GRFALIDTDGSDASTQALGQALLQEIEPQLALREGQALCPRLSREVGSEGGLVPPPGPWRLEATRPGTLESLELIPNPKAVEPLGPTEVRVAVHAAGLNFRDVLVAVDLYPEKSSIGGEGAGVVVEIGSEVTDLSPGDRVMGMIFGSFGPLAVTERDLIAPMPAAWTFEQAAGVPIVFLTAHYGLIDLASLKAGEKVLIHAGAGGVGMSAIQLAQHLGAEVFATASPSKWDVLRKMGIEEDHIASSRELDFKDKFLKTTEGEGVDVVLDSLAREFVDASLDLLPGGGRFIEMGKTDVRDPQQVAAGHPGVTYRAFDMTEAGAERIGEMLADVLGLFERGAYDDLPVVSFDMRHAPEAFRLLREGNNVGKVVLTPPRPIDPDKTVLLTGATGGLGALVARHLVEEHGARHLLLVSRSGPDAKGAEELEAELTELGAEVAIAACDVSDRDQLKELIDSIPAEHPLDAVIHAAGVLADATIESITTEQIEHVFSPKAKAAWNLHELTKDRELSSFVLFSSVAGVLGGPGQGTYAAANSLLD
ncbi:MAG TPA: SDR family NAD(P)-dependent oxidoreductase, partial [Solirubrobacterales bacterium]